MGYPVRLHILSKPGRPLIAHLPEQKTSTLNPGAKENVNYFLPQSLRLGAPWGTTTARTKLVWSPTSSVTVKTTVETDLMKTHSSAVRLGPSRAGQGEGLHSESGKLGP